MNADLNFRLTFQTSFKKDKSVDVPAKKEQPAYKPAAYDTAELELELGLVRIRERRYQNIAVQVALVFRGRYVPSECFD